MWKSITQGPHKFSKTKEPVYSLVEYEQLHEKYTDMANEEKEKLENELNAKKEICFDLSPNTFLLLSSCKIAHDIWNRLKEWYLIVISFTLFELLYVWSLVNSKNNMVKLLIKHLKSTIIC